MSTETSLCCTYECKRTRGGSRAWGGDLNASVDPAVGLLTDLVLPGRGYCISLNDSQANYYIFFRPQGRGEGGL